MKKNNNVVSTPKKSPITRQPRAKIIFLRYAVLDKKNGIVEVYHYKSQVSRRIGISVRTLDRNIPYENGCFGVYPIERVEI